MQDTKQVKNFGVSSHKVIFAQDNVREMRGETNWKMLCAAGLSAIVLVTAAAGREWKGRQMPESVIPAREWCISAIDSIFTDDETSSLAKALFIGDKSGIGKETRDDFRKSGASHLLALSGLHLGILYSVIRIICRLLPRKKTIGIVRGILTMAVLGFYALMTGMGDSIARAYVMICIYELAEMAGRRQKPIWVLVLSAIIILSINPSALHSISFQLSYSAMAGIFLILPYLKSAVTVGSRIMSYLWQTLALSVSCQLATLPLVLWYFGYFPKYFLITNLLCVPLTSAALTLTAAGIAAYAIYPEAGIFIGDIAGKLDNALIYIVSSIASLP